MFVPFLTSPPFPSLSFSLACSFTTGPPFSHLCVAQVTVSDPPPLSSKTSSTFVEDDVVQPHQSLRVGSHRSLWGCVWAVSTPCLFHAATASILKGGAGRSWMQHGTCTAMLLYCWGRADTINPPSLGDNSCEHTARWMGHVWQDPSYLKLV